MVMHSIPRLFDKSMFDGKERERVKLIYSNSFKNGFAVDLEDDDFDTAYKRYTGFDHISCNYDRRWVKPKNQTLKEEKEKEAKTVSTCDEFSDLDNCQYIENVIKTFKAHGATNNLVNSDHLQHLSLNYDHIIRLHGLFRNRENRKRISHYITHKVNDGKYCQNDAQCLMMLQHINTKRENLMNMGGIDSLFDFLGHKDKKYDALQTWLFCESYDSDALRDDLTYFLNQSNVYKQIGDEKVMKLIKEHLSIPDQDSAANTESLYHHLKYNGVDENKINQLKEFLTSNDWDSEVIIEDVEYRQKSILYQHFGFDDEHILDLITDHMIISEKEKDYENKTAKRVFNAMHSYLMHGANDLFRVKNKFIDSDTRFSTMVQKKKEIKANINDMDDEISPDIYDIDFGRNVLQWLLPGESSSFISFKQEIIHNPASTIDLQQYAQYEEDCNTLINKIDIDIILREMMSLKLYTDTTVYQSAFRRAFWWRNNNKASKQQKKNFYLWAITLYQTFMRYSQPSPPIDNKPALLYHGLNSVFVVESSLPQYNGVFSTTTDDNVANKFSNNTGVIWRLQVKSSFNI